MIVQIQIDRCNNKERKYSTTIYNLFGYNTGKMNF